MRQMFEKGKYNRDKVVDGVWVLGCLEKRRKEDYEKVDNSSKEIMMNFLNLHLKEIQKIPKWMERIMNNRWFFQKSPYGYPFNRVQNQSNPMETIEGKWQE